MASGTIFDAVGVVQSHDGIARQTNCSAQFFTPFGPHTTDAGYVTDTRYRSVWLWNGTQFSVNVTETVTEQAGGIELSGLGSMAPKTSIRLLFEITKYGPIEFEATFQFVSGCTLSPIYTITGTRPLFATDQPAPITLDEAISEAYADPDPDDTFYDTLEFLDSISGEKLLVVYSDEDLSTPQGIFTACKFGCKHPDTEGAIVGAMQITVDFLPKSAQRWIMDTCKARGRVSVYWRQYLGPDQEPDAHYPVPLSITGVEQTTTGATINASFPMLTAMKFPRRLMTTSILPGGLV